MQITQKQVFEPITIILEDPAEASDFIKILDNVAFGAKKIPNDPLTREQMGLLNDINNIFSQRINF